MRSAVNICIQEKENFRLHFFRGEKMAEMLLDSHIVGDVIAEYRTNKGMTQEVLSGLAGIGRSHLSAIERGERKPTLETLYRLSLALDTRMSILVTAIEERLE